MEPAGRRGAAALPLALLVGAVLLALPAGGATAWSHDGAVGLGAAGAGFGAGGGERRYRDLAQRRMESVRSSFGARRDLATVRAHALKVAAT